MDNSKAKKYNNIKLVVGISKGITAFILLFLFVWLNFSTMLEEYLRTFTSNNYLVLLIFTFSLGLFSSILFSPVKYFVEFYLEHKYNLSNQTFWKWIWEDAKEAAVGLVIGVPIILIFYYLLNLFNDLWWLPFGIVLFIISVFLARILPIIILPIFYKVTPLENEELKSKIMELSKDAGLSVENIYKFDMSKNTKKANAAFTGLGKSKRILLGDTLLENYTNDEIETVIAHELGHYKKKHIIKNILIGTVTSFAMFFLISKFYSLSLPYFGFNSLTTISALPLLGLWATLISLIITPISNSISRKFEYEADRYAIETTNKKEAFINTLEKLTDQNLGDREPHPIVEWFFYSHPSIKKRVEAFRNI
ncbi:MAG: M48 family metallopeptidase [Ignavibacteria bacterium]|nr:M48 family metallopeptidase [Ignavibacteria bacterium]